MRRRGVLFAAILIAATVIGLWGALSTVRFRSWLEGEMSERASRALGRQTELKVVQFRPFSLEIGLSKVRIEGEIGGEPLLAIEEVEAEGLWRPLLLGRFELADLRISGLRLALTEMSASGPAADSAASRVGWRLGPAVVRNLSVDSSSVRFARAEVPLELVADDLEVQASWGREEEEYRGGIRFSAGRLRWQQEVNASPISLKSDFVLSESGLALEATEVSAPGLELRGSGEYRPTPEPIFHADVTWEAKAAELPLSLLQDLGARGEAKGGARIRGLGSSMTVELNLEGSGLSVRSVPIDSASSRLVRQGDELHVEDFEARVAGLEIAGSGRLGLGQSSASAVRAAVTFRGDEVGPLLELAGATEARLAGSVDGEVWIEGTGADVSGLHGGYRVRSKDLHSKARPTSKLQVDARGTFAGNAVELAGLEVEGPGVGVSASGRWRPAGRSELKGRARIRNGSSATSLLRDFGVEFNTPWADRLEEVGGTLEGDFELSAPLHQGFDWKSARGSLEVRGERLAWIHHPVFEVASELRLFVDRGEPALDLWRLAAPGLTATIRGLPTPAAHRRYEVALSAPDASPTTATLARVMARSSEEPGSPKWVALQRALGELKGGVELTGSISGLQLGARIEDLSGTFDLALRELSVSSADENRLTATLRSAFAEGQLNVERFHAMAVGVEAEAAGRVGIERADQLLLKLNAPDLSASLESARSGWGELGLGSGTPFRMPNLSGVLMAEAEISGAWPTPNVSGSLTVRDLLVAGHDLGDLESSVDTQGRQVRYAGHLGQEGSEVELEGVIELGDRRRVTLRGRIDRQPLAPFVELAGLQDRVSGEVEGRLEMAWPERVGSGTLRIVDGVINGLPVEELDTEWSLDSDVLEIVRGESRLVGGLLSFDGRLGLPGESSSVRFASRGLRLEKLFAAFDLPVDVSGTVGLEGQISGALDDPRVEARIATGETKVLDRRTPDLAGPATLDRSGLKIELASADGAASVGWAMDFAPEGLWSGALEYPLRLALDEWLSGNPVGKGSIVEGLLRADLELPPGQPELATGRVLFDRGRLTAGGYPMRFGGRVEALLDAEVARVLPFLLQGEGTELAVQAELTKDPLPRVSLQAKGLMDLRALQAFSPGLKTGGVASLDLEAAGPWPDFDWQGTATVSEGAVQHSDLPAALDKLNARVEMGPREWTLRELSARLGGGSLSAGGKVAMEGFRPGDYRLDIDGEGIRLAYPEGLRSQFDLDLTLARSGDGAAQLTGEVAVLRALYDRDVGLERSILARRRGLEPMPESGRSWADDVALEVTMVAPEGLWVRNDLASIETRGELKIQGTLSRPRPSGRIEALEGGRIYFREVSYYVTQGTFDYLGGAIADPRLAIRAETSVSEYDVTLTVAGRLSDPVFELTSNPSLPTADIVALLVTGSTRDQFVAGAGGLSQAQAATYLSSGVTRKLETSLRKSLGLDEVQLDPVLVEGQTNPAARVTVGKAITPRLYASYSSRLGTAQKDVYQTKYRLSERLNLVGTRDDDGSLSTDLRYTSSRLQRSRAAGDPSAGEVDVRRTISEIDINGNQTASKESLIKLLGLRTGEDFRRARLLEGLDRLRGWYLERRYPEVEVAYRVLQADNRVRLEIDIAEGREVRLRFSGLKKSKHLERPILELWSRSLFREDIALDAATKVKRLLAQDGYVSAEAKGALREQGVGVVEATFLITTGPRVRVATIEVRGNSSLDEKRIREQILTRRGRFRGGWLNPELLAEDVEAIRALYASSGFTEAAVSSSLDFPKSDRRAVVTFAIEEGPRYSLRSCRFSGNEEVSTPVLERTFGVSIGEPYRDDAIRLAQVKVEELYDGLGYPDARVFTEASVDRDVHGVDLVIVVEEGKRQRVEAIEIDNPGITRESVIRREVELAAGEPLRREGIEATQYRLYRTGLFRSVRLESLPGSSEDSRRVRVSVDEAKNLRKEYGLGWDSEEGPRATANIAHTNVGGRRFHVGAGGRWSPVDRRFQFFLRNPSMGGSRVAGLASAFWEDEERENFDVARTGLSLQLSREYGQGRISLNAGFDLSDVDEEQSVGTLTDAIVGDETTRLGSLRIGAARNTRDSSFWPTTGTYARAEASLFHSALTSEAEFWRLFLQWNRYSRVLRDGVWSLGLRSGMARPFGGSDELPISERYFAGGETSLRGFSLDSLIASGTPPELAMELAPGESLGGDALLVLNQEVTFPIGGPIYGLVFYDVGNLYWGLEDLDPSDLRHSAGVGLRLRSPFGPIRLEYGWKLDRRTPESAGQAHFSLGLAF